MSHSSNFSDNLAAWQLKGRRLKVCSSDHQVFVVDVGDQKASAQTTIILLHGFPESSYSYAKAVDLLLQRFKRVVAFDFLGFGFSDKPKTNFTYSIFEHADTALNVFKGLGLSGAHIVGHDMGDTVLAELLVRVHQNRPYWFRDGFCSVTLTNGGLVYQLAKLRLGQKALLSRWGKSLASGLNVYEFFRRQIYSAHGNTLLAEADIGDMYAAMKHNSWQPLIFYLMQYQKERMRFQDARWLPIIQKINVPIHVCWGADDRVSPVAIAKHLKQNCPAITLSVVDGLGHFAQIQDPKRWAAALEAFWSAI